MINKKSTYDTGYETEPIGGGNPYYRCIHCKQTDPQINGNLLNHNVDCEYRINKIFENQIGKSND